MIQGANVALGPILPPDLTNILIWGDDPQIAQVNEPYIPKNIQREIDFWMNAASDRTRVFFAIREKSSPEIVGHVQIMTIEPIHRSAVLGILVGEPANRGKGLGKEAMRLAIDYCWQHLNLTRLTLSVHATNVPAIALYESLGFQTEGLLRQAQFINGDWVDLRLMALMQARH